MAPICHFALSRRTLSLETGEKLLLGDSGDTWLVQFGCVNEETLYAEEAEEHSLLQRMKKVDSTFFPP